MPDTAIGVPSTAVDRYSTRSLRDADLNAAGPVNGRDRITSPGTSPGNGGNRKKSSSDIDNPSPAPPSAFDTGLT